MIERITSAHVLCEPEPVTDSDVLLDKATLATFRRTLPAEYSKDAPELVQPCRIKVERVVVDGLVDAALVVLHQHSMR